MRWKTTAALAILLAGLATFFYVYEVRRGPAREKAQVEKDRLWKDLESKDIEEVTIVRAGETIRLRKAGEAWSLTAPVEARAESRPVEDLLLTLAAARVEREIEANPSKPEDFGLREPAVEIAFRAKGAERRIRLGAKNPTGTWVYAQEGSKPAVILVPDSLLRDSQKSPADFRDRTVLAFERRDLRGIEVQPRGSPRIEAQLKGTDDWQVTAPVAVPADREQISNLIEALRGAKVKEFVTQPPKTPNEYGLAEPVRLVLWLGDEKNRASKVLRFGATVADKKAVYAQREGDPTVFLVEETLWKAVPATVSALRDKTVFSYDRAKLERVELESPKGKLSLTVEGGAWRMTAPVQLPADDGRVNQLLGAARDLRAQDFVTDDGARRAQFGLDRPQVRLALWEKDAKEPKVLLLAPAREPGRAYATTAPAAGPVVVVDAKVLEALARSPQDLRDRSLFAAFETTDVTRVQIERQGQTLVLERTGEEDWQLVAPRRGKARSARVSELVWTLRNLKWKELVDPPGPDAARWGLEPPGATVTLFGKDGKVVATLAVGKREKDDTYVRVPGRRELYAVESKGLGEIPSSPEDILL